MTLIRTFFTDMRNSVRPLWHLRPGRLWEVDALRGVAIVLMVIYHLMWDLRSLAGYKINLYQGFWHYVQRVDASMFIGLVGISLTLRYHSMQRRGSVRYGPYFRRGVVIFAWGVVVGLVTFLFDPPLYVRFGILHLIGVSILFAYPFVRYRWLNAVLGLLLLGFGRIAGWFAVDSPWLGWLGLDATPRPALDYFPMIPWFGVVLLGIFVGHLLFPGGRRRWHTLESVGKQPLLRVLQLSGQNALLLYLIHQPLLVLVLTLLGVVHL